LSHVIVLSICHSCIAYVIYFKALANVIWFHAALSLHMLVAGSDCCSESSWQHCDRDRWADTGCAELWCVVSFPCPSDTPEREDMQGIKRLIINKMFMENQNQLLHYLKCWGTWLDHDIYEFGIMYIYICI